MGEKLISVIDYGVANLGSMLNMLRKIGARAELVSTPEAIERAEKILLPGVGAFDHGMSALSERGMAEPLKKKVQEEKVPLLGVCLGMQMLGNGSEEGQLAGLGLIDACCQRFSFDEGSKLKIPHMGWGQLLQQQESRLLDGLDAKARFYFVHSYHLVCANHSDVLATANYGREFVAMIQHGNIYGAQFHPEKSHRFGMALLKNFAEI